MINKVILNLKDKGEKSKNNTESDYTFQPSINKNSLRIAVKCRPQGEDIADLLYQKKVDTETKLFQMRKQKEDDELIDCTFHPQIWSNSSYLQAYKSMKHLEEIN